MSYLSQINGRTIVDIYYSSSTGLRRATDMYNVVGSDLRKWVKRGGGGYIPEHYYIQKEDETFLFLSENGLPMITE